jgi:hypothetical protein
MVLSRWDLNQLVAHCDDHRHPVGIGSCNGRFLFSIGDLEVWVTALDDGAWSLEIERKGDGQPGQATLPGM